MVVVAKELIQKLREARQRKIKAERPISEIALYEFDTQPKERGAPRVQLTGRRLFEREVRQERPFAGRRIINRGFYKNGPPVVSGNPIPLWRLSLRMTRNNAFVTLTDTQDNNRILYWTSARQGDQNYRLARSPGRVLEMIVPAMVKAMVEGAQLKYLVFRGTFRYVNRVLRSIRRRSIPVWHIMLNPVAAHNGCRRRKQVRK
jgi:ribosomal protein S11